LAIPSGNETGGADGSACLLSLGEFEQISELAYRTCGIDLRQGKQPLVQARLGKKLRQGNFASFSEYYEHVVADRTGAELIDLLDALTTNFTSFLREPTHFEFLRKSILPDLNGPIRIWSAGCSSGEEPFTIAFSLLEELGMEASARCRILATDISIRAIKTAQGAAYPADRFCDFPTDYRGKYLLRGSHRWDGWYRVKPPVRGMIEFHRSNLMEPFHYRQPFQVIFCRNVMIYFNKATQTDLVNRFAPCLAPGGYLLIGHSESLTGLTHPYRYVQPAVYRKPL
jgi:chemotaxis protein methyltransferase CheR